MQIARGIQHEVSRSGGTEPIDSRKSLAFCPRAADCPGSGGGPGVAANSCRLGKASNKQGLLPHAKLYLGSLIDRWRSRFAI